MIVPIPVDVVPREFFVWAQHSYLALLIERTTHLFTIIETIHILSYTILLGTTVMVDLRLLGVGIWRTTTPQIARELEPWMVTTLCSSIVTGVLMFSSEALRLSRSGPFFWKMVLFSLAVIIHFTIHWKASMRGVAGGAWFGKMAACLSLFCWFGVALAGRGIAFLP